MQVPISHHRLGVARYATWRKQRLNQEIFSRINIRVCMCVYISARKLTSHLSRHLIRLNTRTKETFSWPGRQLLVKANCLYAWLCVIGYLSIYIDSCVQTHHKQLKTTVSRSRYS